MNEMKPAAWLVEDCEGSCFATVDVQIVADFMADTDSVSAPLYTAKQFGEAVAAEREKNDALIRSLAVGYERMRGVLCKMAATSGPDTSWYRHQATQGMDSVPGIWDIAKIPVEAEPGECSWINRDGSLEAIRSAAK